MSQIFFILALVCLFFRHCKQFRELNWNWWKKFKLCCCCTKDEVNDKSIKPLDPFNDDHKNEFIEPTSIAVVYQHKQNTVTIFERQPSGTENGNFFSKQDTSTSTLLQGERLCHYNTWFAIGLVMMVVVGLIFFCVQYINYDYSQVGKPLLEISTTFLYAWSLVRTIVSCFIFSKLMYAIQRKCEEIEMYVYFTNDNINKTNDNKVKEYVETIFD